MNTSPFVGCPAGTDLTGSRHCSKAASACARKDSANSTNKLAVGRCMGSWACQASSRRVCASSPPSSFFSLRYQSDSEATIKELYRAVLLEGLHPIQMPDVSASQAFMEGLGSLDCNLSMGKLGILQHVCSEDRPYCGRSAQAQQDVDLLQSKSYAPRLVATYSWRHGCHLKRARHTWAAGRALQGRTGRSQNGEPAASRSARCAWPQHSAGPAPHSSWALSRSSDKSTAPA